MLSLLISKCLKTNSRLVIAAKAGVWAASKANRRESAVLHQACCCFRALDSISDCGFHVIPKIMTKSWSLRRCALLPKTCSRNWSRRSWVQMWLREWLWMSPCKIWTFWQISGRPYLNVTFMQLVFLVRRGAGSVVTCLVLTCNLLSYHDDPYVMPSCFDVRSKQAHAKTCPCWNC